MNYSAWLLGLLALGGTTIQAYVPIARDSISPLPGNDSLSALAKRDDDPTDFSWVKRWAAIGDSYTAGIGSGNPLGGILTDELSIVLPDGKISGHGDWYCARYDQSYPMILDRLLGGQVENFQYFACSGDRSEQIYQQAQHLEGDLDLVVMTAGGNDLCLVRVRAHHHH
jgi:lysophospholipase L1-like esterase